jgi:Uma2 family endonuclease
VATAEPLRERRTAAEWLAWEEQQRERYEYLGVEPTMMPGGTLRHSAIITNITGVLRSRLRGTSCRPYASEIKCMLPSGRWTYPDVLVTCGVHSADETKVADSRLVVEVLSPGTANYDLEFKRLAYYGLPTLQHIVFVRQELPLVELVTRADDGSWRSVMFTSLDHELPLTALGVTLTLAGIYEDITFDPSPELPAAAPA